MESSNGQQAKGSPAPSGGQRRIWLRIAVAGIFLIVGWCLWLFYPEIWMRICVTRIAGFYVADDDPATGLPAKFVHRPTSNNDVLTRWEKDLANEPIPRLLGLLDSRDPFWVWTGAHALEQQITGGRREGWPGKLVPAEPVDAEVAKAALNTLDRETSPATREALVRLLLVVRLDIPGTKEILLKATDHPDSEVRYLATRVLNSMDMESDETFAISSKLQQDSSVQVRRAVFSAIVELSSKTDSRTIPARYWPMVQEAANDSEWHGRYEAAKALSCMDLDWDITFELAEKLLKDEEKTVREGTMASLVNWSRIHWSGVPRRTSDKLPARYDELVVTLLNDPDPNLRAVAFRVLLAAPGFPPERLWSFVENEMKSPMEYDLGWQLRRALFSPEEPASLDLGNNQRVGSSDPIDVGQLRSRLRPLALEARPRLLEWATAAITDEDVPAATAAIRMLEWIVGDQSELITPALFHPAAKVRSWALNGFRRVDNSEDPTTRSRRYGSPGYNLTDEQFARAMELLDDPDTGAQVAAAQALTCWQGEWSPEQFDRLTTALRHGSESSRDAVFELIWSHAPDAPELYEAALKSLQSSSSDMRLWGARRLARLGNKAIDALPQLLEGIRTGRLGAEASEVVVKLGQPIESPDDVQCLMTTFLNACVVPGQQRGTSADYKLGLAWHTKRLKELVALCPREPAIKSLLEGLNHSDESARTVAAQVLTAQPGDASGLVTQLVAILRTSRWEARQAALLCLAEMGTPAQQASDALIERLQDEESRVRTAAADVLGKLGPAAGPEAAAALARMARDDKYPGSQAAAVRALGNMGKLADPWTSTLQQLSKNGDLSVQREANQALSTLNSSKQ